MTKGNFWLVPSPVPFLLKLITSQVDLSWQNLIDFRRKHVSSAVIMLHVTLNSTLPGKLMLLIPILTILNCKRVRSLQLNYWHIVISHYSKTLINQTLKGWRYSSVKKQLYSMSKPLVSMPNTTKHLRNQGFLLLIFNCKEIISLFFNSFFSDSLEQMVIFQQVNITLYSSEEMWSALFVQTFLQSQ